MRLSAFALLLVIISMSWLLLIFVEYWVFVLVIPIQPPANPPYYIAIEYVVFKLLLALIAIVAWLYSYFGMRNAFAAYKRLRTAPTPSA